MFYSLMFSFPTPDYICLAHMALLEIGLRLGQAREGVSHARQAREGVSHAGQAREGVSHATIFRGPSGPVPG